tara:strand:- start:637 stop:978 length:342 start_codon:yes stop_codon:yes gene_type:complete
MVGLKVGKVVGMVKEVQLEVAKEVQLEVVEMEVNMEETVVVMVQDLEKKESDLAVGKVPVCILSTDYVLNHLKCMYNHYNNTIFRNKFSKNHRKTHVLLYESLHSQHKFLQNS